MKIAVEGCCHGHLDEIYARIAALEHQHGYKVDLLLICGDFQAIRNMQDLACMSVPDKYKALGGFHKYYTGETVAPILTIVIGGNHEASNYMWELYHGGWLAQNIYFLGHAGCVRVNGVRIAGASGIFNSRDFHQGHHERIPYDGGTMRSVYHIREYNVRRLSLLSRPDIFLSHDWPAGIEHNGDLNNLLRRKSFFRNDISKGQLGSPPLRGLLYTLKPAWWFSAHLHVRYEARVVHDAAAAAQEEAVTATVVPGGQNPDEINIDEDDEGTPGASTSSAPNPDEIKIEDEDPTVPAVVLEAPTPLKANPDAIMLDDEEDQFNAPPAPPAPAAIVHSGLAQHSAHTTRFLSLDKCLPQREFLEVIDYPTPENHEAGSPLVMTFDPEWLAIVRTFVPLFSRKRQQPPFPDEATARASIARELEWVSEHALDQRIDAVQTFEMTVAGGSSGPTKELPKFKSNPQTEAFCSMLQIENQISG